MMKKLHTLAALLVVAAGCNAFVTTSDYRFERQRGAGNGVNGGGPPVSNGSGTASACDDFERSDSLELGNGWIEKDDDAFQITAGTLQNTPAGPGDWKDNVAYWGTTDANDLEASVVVRFNDDLVVAHPRLLVRAPSNLIDSSGFIKTYSLGIANPTSASLVRQDNNTIQSGFEIIPNIEAGVRYRLTLRIEGGATAMLSARVERDDNGSWTEVGSAEWTDTNNPPFFDAGTAGVAIDGSGTVYFDDFCLTYL